MIWDDVANSCASAGRNEDFWLRVEMASKRFAACSVPPLCVQSVGASTGSSAYYDGTSMLLMERDNFCDARAR
jgi:hypothetical protein